MSDDIYYDPYDFALDAYPHPMWKRMRDEAPLYYNAKYDFYAVSRYADVRDMSGDWRTYSSAKGSILELIDAGPDALALVKNLLFEDPPEHDEHRTLLVRSFAPKRIVSLEPKIRELCVGYLDQIGSEGFDFVRDYGAKIPMMVIGMLLGVPEPERDYVREMTDELTHRPEGDTGYEGATRAQQKMLEYFTVLVDERRAHPEEDLISDLANAEIVSDDGQRRRMDQDELLRYISIVAAAGNETVANLLGWAGIALFRNPDQRAILAADPTHLRTAIEELLRFEAPSPIQARVVMKDVELYGQTVPQGSKMALLTGSAGRDDRVYQNPDVLDVTRRFDNHLSFGFGTHFCLGAALARLEGRIALEEMLVRRPQWVIDESRAEMVHTSTVRGWASLPVEPLHGRA